MEEELFESSFIFEIQELFIHIRIALEFLSSIRIIFIIIIEGLMIDYAEGLEFDGIEVPGIDLLGTNPG